MKKIFLLFLSLATSISCSKDNSNKIEQEELQLYRMSVQRGNEIRYLYALKLESEIWGNSFDGNIDHVIKVYYVDQANNNFKYGNHYDLTYENDRIIFRDKSKDNSSSRVEVYYIENGRITSMKTFSSYGHYKNNTPSGDHSNYEYNSEGYLYKRGDYEFIYDNGNLSAIKRHTTTPLYELKYNNKKRVPFTEFLTGAFGSDNMDRNNPLIQSLLESVLYEKGFLGKVSKDQLASVKFKDGKQNTFTYEYDGGGVNSITKNSYEGTFRYWFEYK